MSITIKDGRTANTMRVREDGRATTHAVIQAEAKAQSVAGDSFSINTKLVSITGDTALLYIKNNDAKDLHVDFAIMFIGANGTHTGETALECTRNPTGGTLISGGTAAAIKANQNFGHSQTFSTIDALTGADLATVTGGEDISFVGASAGLNRTPVGTSWVLPTGSSAAFKILPNLTSGAVNAYVAVVGYLEEAAE